MTQRKLPIGIQSFRKLRAEGCYYVDKTPAIERLLDEGSHFFLSRPRRFGKSLFLDTLKELFEGNESLFRGLAIHGRWDWSVSHPVIRMSFGGGHFTIPDGLQNNVIEQLEREAHVHGIESVTSPTTPERFGRLIRMLHESTEHPVVVLVDEYDKPILDALETPAVAKSNRDYLRGLYAVIKDYDADIRFCFITGVSKFSKVSLFSGLNNLKDITLVPRYSSICGYTESDLEEVFASQLEGLDREHIRDWYNGYSWRGTERVYNPFDILLLFDSREFRAHWFETGTPTFLVRTLVNRRVRSVDLDGMVANDDLLSTFDVDEIAPEALLFQTGYLTIVGEETRVGQRVYRLGYPNREVRQGLNHSLSNYLMQDSSKRLQHSMKLYGLLSEDDTEGLRTLIHSVFASVPYEWYTNNDIANYEGYYASVFYSYFAGLGLDLSVEDSVSQGRLDMALRFEDRAYIFEFKVVEQAGEGSAMAQLKDRAYADKYRADAAMVKLVAVEFSSESRNIVSFETAIA